MLYALQRKEVEYAIRAIPLGGFVAFPDDDPKLADKYPKDDPDLMKNRPIKDRALVISAGIIANCIFAFSILCAQVQSLSAPVQQLASQPQLAEFRTETLLGTPDGPLGIQVVHGKLLLSKCGP